jgi:hypothetical protein
MLIERKQGYLSDYPLQRREALQVFHETCKEIPDARLFNSVSLTPISKAHDFADVSYELKIRGGQNSLELERITSISEKHGLIMENSDGTMIIHGPAKTPVNMSVVA